MTDEFDPTREGMERYKKTNMSKSAYFQMRKRWLQQQARREGYKGSMLSYVPRGYNRAYTMSSAEKNKQYWKPEAVARTDFQAPWAVRRADKPAYWDDPQRVGRWYDFLRLQSEDYEPPDWLDKDAVTALYKELKNFVRRS